MASFRVVEHVLPGQHIREYHHSIKGRQEAKLQLAVKQYIPLDQPQPIPDNAVTIIGMHGNGSLKEMLEPLWDDLYAHLKRQSVPLRGIWIADVSNQGASGVLNEDVQGDTTSWYDHSRDVLHMVNHFRDEMPRPLIGVAHSIGCAVMVNLSIIHPRLLSTLVLYEPVIMELIFKGPNPAKWPALRKDVWDSREKAESALRRSVSKWDPRVAERYLRYGLRAVPTQLYNKQTHPDLSENAVTLTTSKHHESWGYTTPSIEPESAGLDRLLLPDWDVENERPYAFSRPECWSSWRNLPFVRPSVFWVFGEYSYVSSREAEEVKMQVTGTGTGGSGGAAKGMVEKALLEKGGHNLVYEQVDWSARVGADWIGRWFRGWLADEEFWNTYQSKRSDAEMLRLSDASLKVSEMPNGARRFKGKL